MPCAGPLTCNPREQNHGRDDRDKKKDVVEVDQNCARALAEVRRFAV
jgi:hypothetical protein